MVWAVALNSVMAFAFVITLLFCIGDIDAALSTPTGFPIIQIFYQTTKSKAGATVLVCMILVSNTIGVFGAFASVSRLTWAFARDKGLPFSSFFSYVSVSFALDRTLLTHCLLLRFTRRSASLSTPSDWSSPSPHSSALSPSETPPPSLQFYLSPPWDSTSLT